MLDRTRSRRWLALAGLLLGIVCPGRGADAAEQVSFDAAQRAFLSGSFPRAATEFSDFTNRFPASTLKVSAARRAWFAQGEAELERKPESAAPIFAAFQQAFPTGELSVDAALREATAWFRSGDPAKAIGALEKGEGPFLKALAAGEPKPVLLSGLLLTAEARLGLKDPAAARKAIEAAKAFAQEPLERWTRTRLEVRVLEAAGNREASLESAAALRALCEEPSLAARRAESAAVLGRLLFEAGQPDRAVASLEENLAPGVSAPWRADAIERLADWWIRRGELGRAREQLERILASTPEESATPPIRLRLAQVLLRQFQTARGTNRIGPEGLAPIQSAALQLDRASTNTLPATLLGPLSLARGWCWWEEAAAADSRVALTNALLSFSNAIVQLPASPEREVARFKWADVLALLGDAPSALTAYLEVAESTVVDPATRATLIPAALEQAVVAAVAASNAPAGEKALRELLRLPAASVAAGRGALLLGNSLVRQGAVGLGRGLFLDFLQRFTNSSVRPEVELELAAIALHEERWTNAVADLRSWIGLHTNHPAAVRAGFHLAYALARSGDPASAMEQFSTLAAQHPGDQEALTAQLWLAGNFFEQQDFLRAGQACAAILTNSAARAGKSPTWFRAKLWAAEAGRKLQNFDSAAEHFRELLNDKSAPPEIQAAAYFHYGEMLLEKPSAPGAEPLAGFRLALEAFSQVPEFTNSPYAAPALGMAANCYFQLGSLNPSNYEQAAKLYRRAAKAPGGGILSRSQAWLGLAEVTRKQAELKSGTEGAELTDRAINLYEDIAYGRILEPGEALPPTAIAEASRSAGELLERLGRTRQAAGLYENAARELPTSAAPWSERARRLREAMAERPL
jgi:TolA-binding protein